MKSGWTMNGNTGGPKLAEDLQENVLLFPGFVHSRYMLGNPCVCAVTEMTHCGQLQPSIFPAEKFEVTFPERCRVLMFSLYLLIAESAGAIFKIAQFCYSECRLYPGLFGRIVWLMPQSVH